MILYESISWKGPFSASIVSSLTQPGCLSKAAHLCHGFLHGRLGVVFFGCCFFVLKSGNNKSWYSETHIYFLETLPRCLLIMLGTWFCYMFTKWHGLLHFPQTPGLLPLQISELALEPPTSSEKSFMSLFNGLVKELQVSQEKSHNQAVNNLLVTVIQEAQSWQSIWVNMVLLAVSRLQLAGWKLGEIPSYLCFFVCCGSHAEQLAEEI